MFVGSPIESLTLCSSAYAMRSAVRVLHRACCYHVPTRPSAVSKKPGSMEHYHPRAPALLVLFQQPSPVISPMLQVSFSWISLFALQMQSPTRPLQRLRLHCARPLSSAWGSTSPAQDRRYAKGRTPSGPRTDQCLHTGMAVSFHRHGSHPGCTRLLC
jgi:hypothetical protein